jgi:5-amino-6-(5-phosphoribosylamino)uracil reductase
VRILEEEYAVRRLLLEGGGETNFAFLDAGLVDEIYLTLAPYLIGGKTVPTPVGGVGFTFDRIVPLTLLDLRVEGDEVFLHYRVTPFV